MTRRGLPLRHTYMLLILLAIFAPTRSVAIEYQVEVVIDEEGDIDQLYFDGEIDGETRDKLRSMLLNPVDLNKAGRDDLYDLPGITYSMADEILKYREEHEKFATTDELAAILSIPEDVLEQVRPFVTVAIRPEIRDYEGDIQAGTIYRAGFKDPDGELPGAYLRGTTKFLRHGGVGFLMAVRPMIGLVSDVSVFANDDARADGRPSLSASPTALRFDPASLYIYWDGPRYSAILGSYRIGFGQRLTMDNSRHQRPHGWYPSADVSIDSVSGKVRPDKGFMGGVFRVKQLDLPVGWLDFSVFGSYWHRDIYYSDIGYNRCPAGREDCSSPKSPFLVDSDGYDVDGETIHDSLSCEYPSLPWVLREVMGGANFGYWVNERNYLGMTGYVGWVDLLLDGPSATDTDMAGQTAEELAARTPSLADASPYPEDRNLFGAVGVHGNIGIGIVDAGAEVTVTDQGDPAAVAKAWIRPTNDLEIIPSVRYFSPGFDNPFSHAEADADEYLGNRARDEIGGAVQVLYRPIPLLRLRLDLDVMHHTNPGAQCDPSNNNPSDPASCAYEPSDDAELGTTATGTNDLDLLFRTDFYPTKKFRFGLWTGYHDEDLSKSGRALSYTPYSTTDYLNTQTSFDFSGGARVYWAATFSTTYIPRTTLSGMVKHTFEDSYQLEDRFDQHLYAWLKARIDTRPGPIIMARVKYYDESIIDDPARSVWASGSPRVFCVGEYADDGVSTPGASDVSSVLGANCRGEQFVEAVLQLSQRFEIGDRRFGIISLRSGYTRWLDERRKWGYWWKDDGSGWTNYLACESEPSRNEFLIQANVKFHF